MASPLAIEAAGLVKSFGETRAVDGVDLAVPRGAVYGVLGPNGAGKTTALRRFTGALVTEAGDVRTMGLDPAVDGGEVRRRTGVV